MNQARLLWRGTLNFDQVVVNDATDTVHPAGTQFWGVWIANSHVPNVQDSATLNWQTVEVSNPNNAFSLRWSLCSGLETADQMTAQPYYVYVRFLDGAGNVTVVRIVPDPITLNAGFTQPTIGIPMVVR